MSKTVADRYEVRREIAQGGMGAVFEARHVYTGRPIALKLVPAEVKNPQLARARLLREARLLGRLVHPHIVNVLDAGSCPANGPYVALEMLEGRSLDGLLTTRGRLSLQGVYSLGLSLTSALSFAHRHDVVHRDVKPANIFVSRSPTGEGIKLIDLGIASERNDDPDPDGKLTRPGDLLGTLEYIAPEQMKNASLATPASDVYSAGAVLYESLTGEVPSLVDRLAAAPALNKAANLRPDAPRELLELLIQALQPDAKLRLPSAQAFHDALLALSGADPRSSPILGPIWDGSEQAGPSTSSPTLSEPAVARGQSRRRFVRAPYITPCRVLRTGFPALDGRSEDISEGGLLLLLPQSLASGDPSSSPSLPKGGELVRVRFSLPTTGVVVEREAYVRWARDARGRAALGLEFSEPDSEVSESIATYVSIISGEPSSNAGGATRSDPVPAPQR